MDIINNIKGVNINDVNINDDDFDFDFNLTYFKENWFGLLLFSFVFIIIYCVDCINRINSNLMPNTPVGFGIPPMPISINIKKRRK